MRNFELSLRLIWLLCVFLMAAPISAQADQTKPYASEDGAVQFDYPSEWTIEAQSAIFNQRYSYELWTDSSAIAPFLGNEHRSRLVFEITNPSVAGYPEDLSSPLDYARYTLSNQILESTEIEIGGYPAVRVIPVYPAFPTPQPLLMQEGSGPQIIVTPLSSGPLPHEGRFYTLVRDDGWVIIMNMAAPEEEIEQREADLLLIINSLVFDADAAATPFERNLDVYNVSDIELVQTYSSNDDNFSVAYPAGWKVDEKIADQTIGDPIAVYATAFVPPDSDANIFIMAVDVTAGSMGLPLNSDTPEEYMQLERQSTEGERKQFRIGGFDAVSVRATDGREWQESVEYALNDMWVAMSLIKAKNRALLEKYEAETVATLASLRFALGESVISSPVLSVTLPESWVLKVTEQDSDEYYRFTVRPAGPYLQGEPIIAIELYNLEANGLTVKDTNDLKELLAQLARLSENPRILSTADYQIVRGRGTDETTMRNFVEYSLFLVNKDWLMFIRGAANSLDEAHNTLPCINDIIRGMKFTPPEA